MSNLISAFNQMIMHNHKPWGTFAICFVIAAISLSALGMYLGRNKVKSDKVYSIVVGVFALLFVAMEIWHETGRYQEFGGYDWSSFPFQFCSVAMYMCIIITFLKPGKVKNALLMFVALYTSLSGILPLIFAQGNLTRWANEVGVVFSFTWHTLLLILGFFTAGYLNIGKDLKRDGKLILQAFLVFFIVTCVAQVLNVSIHYIFGGWEGPMEGFKHAGWIEGYERDPDSASLFYISPYFVSNIAIVFDQIWLKAGWLVCWLVYVLAFGLGTVVLYAIHFGIRKLVSVLRKDHQEKLE